MDLVGELLVSGLRKLQSRPVQVTRLCPPFKRCLTAGTPFRQSSPAFNCDRLLNRLWLYPKYLKKWQGRFDVFHIIDHSYGNLVNALGPAKTVVTCHDIDTFRCILEPRLERRSFLFRSMTRQILKGLQNANVIVCAIGCYLPRD
jgi:hypothetical protein